MSHDVNPTISIVVPAYNEAVGITAFHNALTEVLQGLQQPYEIIYCNDGSSDKTATVLHNITTTDSHVKLINLSRNFGKEAALTAGISEAHGKAIITIDADGQHPVELIPDFITKWQDGAQVVAGVRMNASGKGFTKNTGPRLFHGLFNIVTGQKVEMGSSDFRLIDRVVQQAFLELPEDDRVTRNLIDWLGFERATIHFVAHDRQAGNATYSNRQLIRLATNSFISSSPRPLYIFGFMGIVITSFSFIAGIIIGIEQLLLEDPLNWNFTGTALLGILILFLVGIVLLSQGILSLYISHIHTQTKQRPLYIIDRSRSVLKQPHEK